MTKKRILFIILATLFAIAAFFYQKKQNEIIEEGPKLKVSFTKNQKLIKGYVLLDQFVFEFGEQVYIFSAYYSDKNDPNLPFTVTPFDPKNKTFGEIQSFSGFEHVRDAQKIKTPWGEGIFLVDHGYDHLSHGGFQRLLVFDEADKKFVDMSDKLNLKQRIFAFNVAPLKNNQGVDDLIISVVNAPGTSPVFLTATKEGYLNHSSLLPEFWANSDYCYMTSHPINLDDKGEGVYLGACDSEPTTQNTTHDRVIVKKDGAFTFLDENFLPERNSDRTWGTVFIHADKKDERFVILTHDHGFRHGDVKVFLKQKNKFEDIEINKIPYAELQNNGPHYFHAVTTFDLDKDGNNDVIGTIRYFGKRQYGEFSTEFSLLNKGDSYEFVRLGLELPTTSEVVSVHTIASFLMMFFHDGTIAFYE